MIEVKSLSKRFGKFLVLNELNLHLRSGECIALIGPNGCGKTTLIKSILGMVVPTGGDILFQKKSILKDIEYRKKIGYMPQIGRYPENMTIGQIFDMVKSIRNVDYQLDEDLYLQFEIEKILHKPMNTLSGGTTQKVSAALAFLFNPEVLILDEPTAGLDPLSSEILKDKVLKEKAKGKLILITSHLLSELDDMVSEIIFMQEGEILFHQEVGILTKETGMDRISKAIVHILKKR
jgi:Cu-processing system ATP-binding protein